MPILAKDRLAMQLQQNWVATHQRVEQLASHGSKDTLDDSLTSLNWLHNLNVNIAGSAPAPMSPPMRPEVPPREGMKVNPNQVMGTNYRNHYSQTDYQYNHNHMDIIAPHCHLPFDRIDYRTNPYVKPPYSYAALICMAMKDSKSPKMTLSAIYSWITDNFMYYRMADPSWQVSLVLPPFVFLSNYVGTKKPFTLLTTFYYSEQA